MTQEELVDKLVSWCLVYVDENKRLDISQVVADVRNQISTLMVAANGGNISVAAKVLHEKRSTLSMRVKIKLYNPLEIDEMLVKHHIELEAPEWCLKEDRG